MKKIAILAAMSVSALAMTTSMAAADYTLNILHINDLHSRIESINRFDSTCSADDEAEDKCFGGIARVKTKIDERRNAIIKEGGNVVLLDAGDQFQGSLFYTTYKGDAAVGFMNSMGFDAMAVGNHEFDDGPEGLKKFIDQAKFPVISGNTIAGLSTGIEGGIQPYVIKEILGEKIGILSVLATDTDETSSPGGDVLLLDEVRYLKGAVAELEGMGVNKIILLSHVGLNRDKEIAAAVDGIDVIVGGHSHTLLSNTNEKAADSYPVKIANPSGKDVPIVQAYAYSKYLGELKVVFDDDGNVTSAEGEPHLLDASVEPNANFAARVEELAGPIEELKSKVVGQSSGLIEGSREVCRAQECAMGNLVADAMLDRTKDQGVQFAIQNGGGLRASIDEGEVTMGEVLTVLPFQNTLATFSVKGSDIAAALENGVSELADGAGRFPQVSGLKYTFDKGAEAGSRISNVMIADGDGFVAVDMDTTYLAATNNYMRNGGDGYKMFASAADAYDFGPGLEQVVADYIVANTPYQPYTDGRISMASMEKAEMEKSEMKKEEMAKPEEIVVAVPETTLGAGALSTSGPVLEAPVMEKAEEIVIAVPETTLGAGVLANSGPTIEAPVMEKKEEMAKEEMEKSDYVIAAGDNYWDLAKKFYGDANMWTKLDEANPDYRVRGLQIGDTLVVPE